MKRNVDIILLDSEAEYRSEYEETFLKQPYSFKGFPVSFDMKSFDHIFFEPVDETNKKGKFSKRRAKKMRFIRSILLEEVPVEVLFEPDRGTLAVFCVDLDCVVYLRNRVGTGKLQIGSFIDFGKEHTKMYEKQRRKCVPITDEGLKELIK